MDPEKFLTLSREHRRSFVLGTLLLCLILVALDILLPHYLPAWMAEVAGGYIRAFVSTIFVALLII
jgi:hypothetical protein